MSFFDRGWPDVDRCPVRNNTRKQSLSKSVNRISSSHFTKTNRRSTSEEKLP
ncbi:hypothetical protein BaRGS_00011942, partial [Batillaria attramentaria]